MSDQEEFSLAGDVLDEALTVPEQEHEEPQREERSAPAQTSGYVAHIQQQINRKKQELAAISERMRTHRETGAYQVSNPDGSSYFDFTKQVDDQSEQTRLIAEMDDLRDQLREREKIGANRSRQARAVAENLARQELPRLPEDIRGAVGKAFTTVFNTLTSNGEWSKATYSDRRSLEGVIAQAFENSVGHVIRSGYLNSGKPTEQGLESGDVSRREEPKRPDIDPYTQNMLYAHAQRKNRSMTFAEAKRAAAEGSKGQ